MLSLKNIKLGLLSFVFCLLFLNKVFAGGILDNTFGNGGLVTTDVGSAASVSEIQAQDDGKIIIVAKYANKYALLRYNLNGSLDSSFGSNGIIVTTYATTDPPVKLTLLTSGEYALTNNFSVIRYNAAGSITSSATFPQADLAISRVDGKIVAAKLIDTPLMPPACQGPKTATFIIYEAGGTPAGSSGAICGSGTRGVWALGSLVANPDNSVYLGLNTKSLNEQHVDICRIDTSSGTSIGCNFRLMFKPQDRFRLIDLNSQKDSKFVALTYSAIIRSSIGNSTLQYVTFNSNSIFQYGAFYYELDKAHGNNRIAALRKNKALFVLNSDFTLNGIAPIEIYFSGATEQNSVYVQSDDKIIVAGQSVDNSGRKNLRLARFSKVFNSTVQSYDFDGDNKSNVGVYRPSNNTWYIKYGTGFEGFQWGLPTDIPTFADYDGDGKFDKAVFRPSNGTWYILNSSNGEFRAVQFGLSGDRPVQADYDGDSKADIAVFRNGIWYFLNSSNNTFRAFQWGLGTDIPVPADYDADGKADVAVFRDGNWYWVRSFDNEFKSFLFGYGTDKLAVGDYDGDGAADKAVRRDNYWYFNGTRNGFGSVVFGNANDITAIGDWFGDGTSEYTFFRNGQWWRSNEAGPFEEFGMAEDIPINKSPGN